MLVFVCAVDDLVTKGNKHDSDNMHIDISIGIITYIVYYIYYINMFQDAHLLFRLLQVFESHVISRYGTQAKNTVSKQDNYNVKFVQFLSIILNSLASFGVSTHTNYI